MSQSITKTNRALKLIWSLSSTPHHWIVSGDWPIKKEPGWLTTILLDEPLETLLASQTANVAFKLGKLILDSISGLILEVDGSRSEHHHTMTSILNVNGTEIEVIPRFAGQWVDLAQFAS